MKLCTKCKVEKDESEFSKRSLNPDGLQNWCKQCESVHHKQYRQDHADEKAAWQHQYYLANRNALLTYRHRYQQEHRDERAEKVHQYNQEHKVELAAYHRKYWEEHPEICRVCSARHRALLLEAEGTFTTDEWLQVLEEFDYYCAYCGVQTYDLTMDHVVPLTKGGQHNAANIVPACQSCNSRKGAKDLDDFLKELHHD